MGSTNDKVRYTPTSKQRDDAAEVSRVAVVEASARGTEAALRVLEGRWKLVILFHLFTRPVWRFSELERAIPGVSQKMLIQQLRELERDGVVRRTVYPQVPPKVEYTLTTLGRALCPALDALLQWAALRDATVTGEAAAPTTERL
jgi:DNA-binding HxlR family transcriptional regulator